MEMDLAYFEDHPDQYGQLSDADRMSLMAGETIKGDITGESPDAEDQKVPESALLDGKVPETEAVVLTKDGKHTIPFEELQQAREQARYWQAQAEGAARQIEQAPDQAPAVDLKDLRRQLREAMLLDDDARIDELDAAIDAEVTRRAEAAAYQRLERRSAEVAQEAAQREMQAVAEKLVIDHPYLDHQGQNPNWEAIAQVQALRDLYAANGKPIAHALADAVAKVAKIYAVAPTAADAVANKAAAAIANAKLRTPTSLSSIPASATPPTDELQAVAMMSPQELQDKLMDMPRDKIMELLARRM